MKWRSKLALGISLTGALAVWGAVIPAAVPSLGGQALATTITRAAPLAASAVPTPKGKPAFDATFHGSQLNTNVWDTCYPKMASYDGGCRNWGNAQEREWYMPSQVTVGGGYLHLIAKREKTNGFTATGAPETYGCRSGMVTSYPGFNFEYGFVQVVASIPHANGLWPALWLAASNGQFPPEVDMVESWGVKALTASFFHPATGPSTRAKYSPSRTRGWRTYSLSWTRSSLKYYVGSKLVLTVKRNIPHQRMYFVANLAEYLPAKRGYCTGQLQIKSVKIWKS